ncbi:MAG TPA: hypothetical protein VKD43_14290 [Xanthobacteraceae bacterium]|nr:hypothetical protein [Xanthobacteraceae bacterium]
MRVDLVEQDLAAAELDDIALAHDGQPWAAWRDAVLTWHADAVAHARAETWVPGMARSPDPAVEETLRRFYHHHIRLTISQLRAENMELRRKLVDALSCARFYASGASDAGARATRMITALESVVAKTGPSH